MARDMLARWQTKHATTGWSELGSARVGLVISVNRMARACPLALRCHGEPLYVARLSHDGQSEHTGRDQLAGVTGRQKWTSS